MTRETFIKKWLGAVVVYNEETKAIMREDLQKVIDKFNEPETFNTECVPYQLCPKCLGAKNITTMSTSMYQICDICNGYGVIPMAKL